MMRKNPPGLKRPRRKQKKPKGLLHEQSAAAPLIVEKEEGAGNSVSCRVWAEPTNLTPQRFSVSTASAEGARCAAFIEKYGFIDSPGASAPSKCSSPFSAFLYPRRSNILRQMSYASPHSCMESPVSFIIYATASRRLSKADSSSAVSEKRSIASRKASGVSPQAGGPADQSAEPWLRCGQARLYRLQPVRPRKAPPHNPPAVELPACTNVCITMHIQPLRPAGRVRCCIIVFRLCQLPNAVAF